MTEVLFLLFGMISIAGLSIFITIVIDLMWINSPNDDFKQRMQEMLPKLKWK